MGVPFSSKEHIDSLLNDYNSLFVTILTSRIDLTRLMRLRFLEEELIEKHKFSNSSIIIVNKIGTKFTLVL